MSILLPHGMRFNKTTVPNRYSRIARAMGVNAGGRGEEDVIEDGILAVQALAIDWGLPVRLRDLQVPNDSFGALAELALGDPTIYTNPRTVGINDVIELLEIAW